MLRNQYHKPYLFILCFTLYSPENAGAQRRQQHLRLRGRGGVVEQRGLPHRRELQPDPRAGHRGLGCRDPQGPRLSGHRGRAAAREIRRPLLPGEPAHPRRSRQPRGPQGRQGAQGQDLVLRRCCEFLLFFLTRLAIPYVVFGGFLLFGVMLEAIVEVE